MKVSGTFGPPMDSTEEYSKWVHLKDVCLDMATALGSKQKQHTSIMSFQAGIGALGLAGGQLIK